MTDESDRMDRARRIREMREGVRRDDERSDDQDGDDVQNESTNVQNESNDVHNASDDKQDDDARVHDEGDVGNGTGEDGVVDDAADGTGSMAGAEPGTADDSPAAVGMSGDGDVSRNSSPDDDAAGDESDVEGDGGGGTLRIPGADIGDVEVDPQELAREAGLETGSVTEAPDESGPDPSQVGESGGVPPGGVSSGAVSPGVGESGVGEAGVGETGKDGAGVAAGARGSARSRATRAGTSADETRVLEFDLGSERYCLDIEHVEEIVKRETVTRVPNTPDFVEGVVDLRGQITTILDPKKLLDIDDEGPEELLVVFDPDGFEDQGAIGWVVDDVNQVTPVAADEVNDSPVDQDHVEGIVDRDGEFVIWTTPELAIGETAG